MTTGHRAGWASLRLRSIAGLPVLLSATAIVLLLLLATRAAAEQRVALVIGNGAYDNVPSLANPLNDAADIGAALGRLGFAVTRVEDADQVTLRRSLQQFALAASASQVVLVFYAGHGIEVDGRNFLVPVDARLLSDRDVEFETVPLDLLSRAVEGARGLRLIVLDACRDNPFAAAMQRAGATRSIGRGLARVEPYGETLVAYAAKEGTVAADGEGRNSPYTEALLAHLEEPGLELGLMFRKVRDAVMAETGGRQEPFVYGSLSSRGAYLGALPEPEPKTPPAGTTAAASAPSGGESEALRALAEREFWASVKDSAHAADIEAYLERYPNGTYGTLARNWLARLQAAPEDAGALADVAATAPEDTSVSARLEAERLAAEREFWASVKESDDAADIQAYLDQYPGGTYEALARNRLARLTVAPEKPVVEVAVTPEEPEKEEKPEPPASASSPPASEAVEASLGLERSERRQIQMGLAELGFDPGPADGLFGWGTRGAIGRWQSSRDGAASGYLDAEAAKLLLAAGEEAARKQAAKEAAGKRAEEEAERKRAAEESARKRAEEEAARKRAAMRPGHVFRDCPKCPEMVVVPAGSFMMGSSFSEAGRDGDEGPRHRVTIRVPFAVGKYEATFAEWDACVAAGGCNGYRPHDEGWGRGRRPAINVSWNDAEAYVAWLSRKTGERYRLLSEAEWEYAARAGTTGPFHFGSTISTGQANYDGNFTYGSGRKGVHREKTMPAGSFPLNGFSLHDMHGNAWEWVEDCWHESYAGAPTNGGAWVSGGECRKRVRRGGSWVNEPWILRSANRYRNYTGDRNYIIGFRIARTLTP